jgi:hypothetical protein
MCWCLHHTALLAVCFLQGSFYFVVPAISTASESLRASNHATGSSQNGPIHVRNAKVESSSRISRDQICKGRIAPWSQIHHAETSLQLCGSRKRWKQLSDTCIDTSLHCTRNGRVRQTEGGSSESWWYESGWKLKLRDKIREVEGSDGKWQEHHMPYSIRGDLKIKSEWENYAMARDGQPMRKRIGDSHPTAS